MNTKEYFQLCRQHDWGYQSSDDGRVYYKGAETLSVIQFWASKHEVFREVFKAWYVYKWDYADEPVLTDFEQVEV